MIDLFRKLISYNYENLTERNTRLTMLQSILPANASIKGHAQVTYGM